MGRLNKALKKILADGGEHSFTTIYDRLPVEVQNEIDQPALGALLERYLAEAGNTIQAVSHPAEKVVSRESLFAACAFRIQLTPFEREDGQLIIGHRLIPFVHPGIPVEQLHFFDEQDRPLSITRHHFPVDRSTSIFFNLLPPYGLSQYLDEESEGQYLNMAVIDLEDWMQECHFTEEDQLLVSVKDYSSLTFYLEKLNGRQIASRRLADRYYDKQLTEAIYRIAGLFGKNFMPVDLHLFWAFAQLEPHLITQGGTPFGPFISQHERLTFFQEGPYTFLQDQHFMEELMESAVAQAQAPPGEMGEATKLNDIFQEMGNSFSKLLLKSCIVEQLLERDKVDEEALLNLIFGDDKYPFYNARQQRHFEQAFAKLVARVTEKWKDRELALPHLQLLRKAIQFKMDIVHLLRELNKVDDPGQVNVQALLQLQPIDQSLDQILDNLLSRKPMPYQEAQALVRQLESGREKFLLFRNDLLDA